MGPVEIGLSVAAVVGTALSLTMRTRNGEEFLNHVGQKIEKGLDRLNDVTGRVTGRRTSANKPQ